MDASNEPTKFLRISQNVTLSDDEYFEVFQFLSGKELAQIRQVCKMFNHMAQQQELWLRVTLRTFHPYSFNPRFYNFDYCVAFKNLHLRRQKFEAIFFFTFFQ